MFTEELFVAPRECKPGCTCCGIIPGVGIIVPDPEETLGPRPLITFWFMVIPLWLICEPEVRLPWPTPDIGCVIPSGPWRFANDEDIPIFELPDIPEVADVNDPRPELCEICAVAINGPDPATDGIPASADEAIPLDNILDICIAMGVAPIFWRPIEFPPAIVAEFKRTWESVFKMLTLAGAGPRGLEDWEFTTGLNSWTLSPDEFISWDAGGEVTKVGIPCEVLFGIEGTWEKAGPLVTDGIVVGSWKEVMSGIWTHSS